MYKRFSLLFMSLSLIFLGLCIRLFFMSSLELKSVFIQPFVFQLLSFSLPFSVYFYLILSSINGFLFYKIGAYKVPFLGFVALGLYAFSPWFIYADISQSIYVFGVLGVLMTIFGYLKNDSRNGYRLLLGGGLLLSYVFLFGFIYYIFLLTLCYRKDRQKLLSGIIPLVPLLCLAFYNIEGLKNIIQLEFSVFNDIGIINAINVFQGNLYQLGWGSGGKLIINKFSYFFLVIFDSICRILSPVTYFSAERRMFGFSNLFPLSFVLILPLLFGLKKLFENKLFSTVIAAFFLLSISSLFTSKIFQLEKLLLIAPFLVFLISFGVHELYIKKYKKTLMIITIIFIVSFIISFIDFSLYENMRLDLFKR